MAQDSIAYGESLLADVRERNAKEQKRAESRAKKDFWKGAAVKIGLDVAKDIMGQRQTAFLNNEENMANKLRVTNATNFVTANQAQNTKAKNYAGGYENYWVMQAGPQVKSELDAQYAAGQYKQADYDLYSAQLSKKWGKKLQTKHEEEYALGNDFLATGATPEAYVAALKKQKPGTLSGGLSQILGNSTGLLKADLNNQILQDMVSAADKVTGYTKDANPKDEVGAYQAAYSQSEDSALSLWMAKNEAPDLGVPASVLGDWQTTQIKSITGIQEIKFRMVTAFEKDKDGKVVQLPQRAVTINPENGQYAAMSQSKQREEGDASTVAALLTPEEVKAANLSFIAFETTPAYAAILKNIQNSLRISSGLEEGDQGYDDALQTRLEAAAKMRYTAGKIAAAKQWGTTETGIAVFDKVINNRNEEGADPEAYGQANVFEKVIAVQDLKGTLPNGDKNIQRLLTDTMELYNTLDGMSPTSRTKVFRTFGPKSDSNPNGRGYLKNTDGSDGPVNAEKFQEVMESLEYIFKNKRAFDDADSDTTKHFSMAKKALVANREAAAEATTQKNEKDQALLLAQQDGTAVSTGEYFTGKSDVTNLIMANREKSSSIAAAAKLRYTAPTSITAKEKEAAVKELSKNKFKEWRVEVEKQAKEKYPDAGQYIERQQYKRKLIAAFKFKVLEDAK